MVDMNHFLTHRTLNFASTDNELLYCDPRPMGKTKKIIYCLLFKHKKTEDLASVILAMFSEKKWRGGRDSNPRPSA